MTQLRSGTESTAGDSALGARIRNSSRNSGRTLPSRTELLGATVLLGLTIFIAGILWEETSDLKFMRSAITAGVLSAVLFGVIGTYVVVRRIVFIAGGIAHVTFGGVGLAFYLSVSVLGLSVLEDQDQVNLVVILCAALFAVLAAVSIGLLGRETVEREETTIGIIWAVGMALGVFFIRVTPGYTQDPASYLFGNILMLTSTDLWLLFSLALVVISVILLLYHRILALAFDEEFAVVAGIRALRLHLFMLILVALTIVFLIKFMGVILVMAMLTIPSSIIGQFTHDLRRIIAYSTVLSALFVLGGLLLSYLYDLESGATIVMLAAGVYLASTFANRVGRRRRAAFRSS